MFHSIVQTLNGTTSYEDLVVGWFEVASSFCSTSSVDKSDPVLSDHQSNFSFKLAL